MKIPGHIVERRRELEKKLVESGEMQRQTEFNLDYRSTFVRNSSQADGNKTLKRIARVKSNIGRFGT